MFLLYCFLGFKAMMIKHTLPLEYQERVTKTLPSELVIIVVKVKPSVACTNTDLRSNSLSIRYKSFQPNVY